MKRDGDGYYRADAKKIVLDDDEGLDLLDVRIHEMMHAASFYNVDISILDQYKRMWNALKRKDLDFFIRGSSIIGRGFEEGITEYLSDKVISENGIETEYTAYSSLVSVTKDIVAVYGDEPVIDAYLGSPEKLEELMAKDGVSYTRFLELVDEQHKIEFEERNTGINGELRRTYKPLGEVIRHIREKHIQRNHDIVLSKSEWEKEYEKMPGGSIVDYNKVCLTLGFAGIGNDLEYLYGNAYRDAFFGGNDEELRNLMAKDGIVWDKFYKNLEYYAGSNDYSNIYGVYEGIKEKKNQFYLNIGKDIEKVRMKRIEENPDIDLPESKWIDFYINDLGGDTRNIELISNENLTNTFGIDESNSKENSDKNNYNDFLNGFVGLDESVSEEKDVIEQFNEQISDMNLNIEEKPKNRLVAWFKNLKDKIVGRFKKSDEVLLLNSGDEKIEFNDLKRNEFLESIKVDESELIYNQLTDDEEKRQEEIRENSENIKMER